MDRKNFDDSKFVASSSFLGRGGVDLRELRLLISPPCTMRLRSLERWCFVNAGSRIWWGCQALSRQSATQRVAFLQRSFYWGIWAHPRSLRSLPVFAPCVHSLFTVSASLNDSSEQKHYPLVLFVHFLSPFFLSLFPILFLVKLGLVKAQSTYFWNKRSWQVSRESCQHWSFSVFHPFFWQRRKDVSSLAEEYAFVGCRRLTHCRSFGHKPGRLHSPGPGCFSCHCSKDTSRPYLNPAFLF